MALWRSAWLVASEPGGHSGQYREAQWGAIAAPCGIDFRSLRTCSRVAPLCAFVLAADATAIVGWRDIPSGLQPSGSRQRGAEPAGCHAHLPAEDGVEVALVGEPGLLCNQGERLPGPAQ